MNFVTLVIVLAYWLALLVSRDMSVKGIGDATTHRVGVTSGVAGGYGSGNGFGNGTSAIGGVGSAE